MLSDPIPQEPLTLMPIVVSCSAKGADGFIDLMARECSAKEVVIAVEEAIESLHRRLQDGASEDEDEDEDKDDGPGRASPGSQLVRLVRSYSAGAFIRRRACGSRR